MTTAGSAGNNGAEPAEAREDVVEAEEDAHELAARMLHDHGLRLTPVRAGVASVLLWPPRHRHLTGPQLVAHLHKRDQRADRATVYRTVNVLSAVGFLHTSPTAAGAISYGLAVDPHHHVLCTRCGAFEPVPAQPLTDALQEIAVLASFEIPANGATLQGLCASCRCH